jgi:hypothetical protein
VREIKFRQWIGGEFHYWGVGINGRSFDGPAHGLRKNTERVETTPHDQYTGLKDKNGVEIYEGDLLLVRETRVSEVVFLQEAGCWDLVLRNVLSSLPVGAVSPASWKYSAEVVGNVHENPDLLRPLGDWRKQAET